MEEVRVPLADLPPAQTSVTFPDSFVAMDLLPRLEDDDGDGDETWRRTVYRLDQLDEVVDEHALPDPPWQDRFTDWRTWPAATFIEIQLWSDDPIREHLAGAVSA
jgi:hypothetical protein